MKKALPVWLAAGAAVALAVLLIEVYRPLAGRDELGPGQNKQAESVPVGSWTLRIEGGAGKGGARVLVDPAGRTIRLAQTPRRIVSQILLTDEVLHAICAPERVVAHSTLSADVRYSNIAAEAQGFDAYVSSNAEAILGHRPDLIFVASYTTLETIAQLERTGVPLIRLVHFDSVEAVRTNIRVIGFAVSEDVRAKALIGAMDARIAAAVAAAQRTGAPKPRVLSWSDGSLPARGTIFDDVITRLGGINIPGEAGMTGWPQVSAEQVGKWDPDVIVLPAAPGDEASVREALLSRPGIRQTRAVRTGRVIVIPTPHYISVTHHVASLVEDLARGVFPEEAL